MCSTRFLIRAAIISFCILFANAANEQQDSESKLKTSVSVQGLVRHRYATVQISSLIENPSNESQETNITIHIPENAFVSYATLEVDGEVIRSQVQERKVVQQQYQLAVGTGATASQVSAARDANAFLISVNAGAKSNTLFNVTYEELLVRRKGRYEMTISVDPKLEMEYFKVDLEIKENKNFTFVNVPPFSSTLTPDDLDHTVQNEEVNIEYLEDAGHCKISYFKEANADGKVKSPGPFVLRYDVDREGKQGEILLLDGHFVHFLSAEKEKYNPAVFPKHAIFVLDSSASMWGSKLKQLQVAMSQILRQLSRQDVFSIVTFGNKATEWYMQGLQPSLGKGVYAVNRRNVADAMDFISRMQATGGTNIQAGLRRALYLAAKYRNIPLIPGVSEGANYTTPRPEAKKEVETLLMFLSDGIPTAGEIRLSKLLKSVHFVNTNVKASIFALAFGPTANYGFLRRMALQNYGFSRRIYESSDTAIQLQSFFQEITSPLLKNVTFTYLDNKVNFSSLTLREFPILFSGSEVVVAGKLNDDFEPEDQDDELIGSFSAQGTVLRVSNNITVPTEAIITANKTQVPTRKRRRYGVLEKIWAQLTIRQLLDNYLIEDFGDESTENKESDAADSQKLEDNNQQRALELALKYGFVTPLTSLIMVSEKKPLVVINSENLENDLKQPDQIHFSDKAVPPMLSPMSIQHAALYNKSTPSEKFEWLSTLLAENDSVTFIKPNGEEITRTVKIPSEEVDETLNECVFKSEDDTEKTGNCRPLLSCPSSQVPTFDEYFRRHCDFDSTTLAVCCLKS
ncbi:Hypothetical predicted protein [Cloeon dipterum]|uniref:VWFA domain-containing protein n=1 Tax=Cloeon dipterum TaxID=197152 RepID=A0A8S1CF27_9INSE|nr:Hypothetical predicted protein [Cloeon dipterum]